ncbi:M61 family metallopeptidase [Umezakia ovalisporum]|uniref:M61 family metallopeptidase n=2 Tax=Umezakia ovalisporum TaxID=75695 RepID=A0AA43GWQ2_9CYAN|nr:M61 family metallopeptidase [Umezakia ovalisporum]MDH6057911.1 M61 family metallopeptidase [Umezakia ovalisporum FSS-43]MDH6062866.1 M61 family metallopeptidase [Umezakia ovalisporum FSS-62]MDH6068747.1 M61 family metallopeptidase [Umezakia ovalisporum APH033B]MDH6071935.1 M61 family metallopeptidase [Umezakia ovalisporum CobakiLakeA]MDH6073349.1 M61 family metallopeptidase [Umezakia ovalisporum CS-1034]
MTEATAPRIKIDIQDTLPMIHYLVAMPQPETHLFEVTLRLINHSSNILDLKMPVWTPGSYLVREYAKNLQQFTAFAGDKPLTWRKISKNHWQVNTTGASELIVTYRIFANELTVRTNHLDSSHGYFNGAALFFRLPGWENLPIQITVLPPRPDWRVTTSLPPVGDQSHSFWAADFDTLVDSPFEIGSHESYYFEVLGKPHELAVWGKGNLESQRAIADLEKIIEVEAEMFGGLPYERYVFLVHLFGQGYGGLEHKNCCSLIYQRFGFRSQDKYERFVQLAAHEFFHLWNVKRIRPKGLEVFDYEQENYTPSLWFCEGTTSYYDLLIPLRAGIYDAKSYLNHLNKEITRFLTTPGRKVQPLAESSFDAWIKLYRPDANSNNSQMSYYLKGEMVSFLLDLLIRARHGNQRSLDDVMRQMWRKFGQPEIGYTPEQLQEVIESVAGVDLTDFFELYVNGTEELPFNNYLEPFGLHLVAEREEEPYMGIKAKTEHGRELIKSVETGSPAQLAGIDAGDELLAIEGIRLTAHQLSDRLKDYQPKDTIEVTVFHQDELRTYSVTLEAPRPTKFQILPLHNLDTSQKENGAGWLGVPIASLR